MSKARRNIKADLRGALAEAKDAIEGKRKFLPRASEQVRAEHA